MVVPMACFQKSFQHSKPIKKLLFNNIILTLSFVIFHFYFKQMKIRSANLSAFRQTKITAIYLIFNNFQRIL